MSGRTSISQHSSTNSLTEVMARGSVALVIRQVIAFSALFISTLVMARIFAPRDLGLVAVMLMIAGFAKILVDGGLSYSLIWQAESPSRSDIDSVFSAQLGCAVVFTTSAVISGVLLAEYAGSPLTLHLLLLSASCAIFMPFQATLCAIMEREFNFARAGVASLVQPLSYSVGVVVVLPLWDSVTAVATVLCISYAVPIPVLLCLVALRPRFRLLLSQVRWRFGLGLPIMAGNAISAFKDSINPIIVASTLGLGATGYIAWAQQVAIIATYALFALSRVFFPVFSRIKSQPDRFRRGVASAALWANFVVAPVVCTTALGTRGIVILIYGEQWEPGVDLLRLLLVANLLAPTAAVLLAAANAAGRTRLSFAYTAVWAVMTWILVPILTQRYGILGYGYANIGVTMSALFLFWQLRLYMTWRSALRSGAPWLIALGASIASVACTQAIFGARSEDTSAVMFYCALSGSIYLGVGATFLRREISTLIGAVRA